MPRTGAGTCRLCGCTQERACLGGCAWADETRTLCTQCSMECARCRRPIAIGDPVPADHGARLGDRHVVLVDELGEHRAALHMVCLGEQVVDELDEHDRTGGARPT